jgi:hypothetical protein
MPAGNPIWRERWLPFKDLRIKKWLFRLRVEKK